MLVNQPSINCRLVKHLLIVRGRLRIGYSLQISIVHQQICSCILSQLLEDIQTGLPGLSAVSHVVMELNSATDHAPIHILQTMEQNAEGLQTKQEHAPPSLKTATL